MFNTDAVDVLSGSSASGDTDDALNKRSTFTGALLDTLKENNPFKPRTTKSCADDSLKISNAVDDLMNTFTSSMKDIGVNLDYNLFKKEAAAEADAKAKEEVAAEDSDTD